MVGAWLVELTPITLEAMTTPTEAVLLQMLVELQRSNAQGVEMIAAAERRQIATEQHYEMLWKDTQQVRARPWDDADKYRGCGQFSGRPSEWEEWYEKFVGTVKAKSAHVHAVLKAVEHKMTEHELEAEGYAEAISALDLDMPEAKEVVLISAKLHRLLGDLTTLRPTPQYVGAGMRTACWHGDASRQHSIRRRWRQVSGC